MVLGKVGAFLEGDAEESGGGVKHAIHQHPLHFEIGAELGFVEGEARLADLLRVEVPVVRGEGEAPLSCSMRACMAAASRRAFSTAGLASFASRALTVGISFAVWTSSR